MVMDRLEDEDEGTFTFQLQDGKATNQSSLVLIGDGKIFWNVFQLEIVARVAWTLNFPPKYGKMIALHIFSKAHECFHYTYWMLPLYIIKSNKDLNWSASAVSWESEWPFGSLATACLFSALSQRYLQTAVSVMFSLPYPVVCFCQFQCRLIYFWLILWPSGWVYSVLLWHKYISYIAEFKNGETKQIKHNNNTRFCSVQALKFYNIYSLQCPQIQLWLHFGKKSICTQLSCTWIGMEYAFHWKQRHVYRLLNT